MCNMNKDDQTQSGASAVLNLRVPEDRVRLIRKGFSTRDLEDLYLQSEEIEVMGVNWQEE
jgi:hypothetical protein